MFFPRKSIIVSFYGLSERLKSCKPTSNANDTFPNSLQKSIIDVSSKYHTVLCCFNPQSVIRAILTFLMGKDKLLCILPSAPT